MTTSSRSDNVLVRGLRYHVRRWGPADAPMLFLMHGWMDVSATFEPVAEQLVSKLQILAPDWRGFGETEWPQDGYWFPDYVGLRPQRVAQLAVLDGLALPDGDPVNIVPTYRRWLDALRSTGAAPTYRSFDELAGRVQKRHPHLSAERCRFIANCWGRQGTDGRVHLQADPKHMINMPRTYLQAESDAMWAQVTAPTLFVDGGASVFRKTLPYGEIARRRGLFRDHREVQIEGVGHMLHFEAPEALAAHLLAFFAP